MKIEIKQLGAIKEASVDIDKSLLLFCGQNNTGKTYLSFVIYALTKFKIVRNKIFSIDIAKLIDVGFEEVSINIDEIYKYKDNTLSELKDNLSTVFGISHEQAIQFFEKFTISFIQNKESCEQKIKNIAFEDKVNVNGADIIISKSPNSLSVHVKLLEGGDYSNFIKENMSSLIISSILTNRLAFYPINKSVIFPVERNSINTFSKELSINRNLLVDQMQQLSTGEKFNPLKFLINSSNRYPIAIKDGLEVSDDLSNIQKKKSEVFEIASELEKNLLNGELSVDKEGNLQFAANGSKRKKLPIHMTASIVKTLSSLIFYLKFQASKGDLIIIDEPEMNLHPDSQILLARIFAKLLNNGFRLIISTHSDYIIREINNLIMLSNPKANNIANELGYTLDEKINPENVGCYYFHYPKPNSRNVMVKTLSVDNEGVAIESIDNEINNQNDRMQELLFVISEEEEDE